MDIVIVGTPEFPLGFQLAGISTLYNPVDDEALVSPLSGLLDG